MTYVLVEIQSMYAYLYGLTNTVYTRYRYINAYLYENLN